MKKYSRHTTVKETPAFERVNAADELTYKNYGVDFDGSFVATNSDNAGNTEARLHALCIQYPNRLSGKIRIGILEGIIPAGWSAEFTQSFLRHNQSKMYKMIKELQHNHDVVTLHNTFKEFPNQNSLIAVCLSALNWGRNSLNVG